MHCGKFKRIGNWIKVVYWLRWMQIGVFVNNQRVPQFGIDKGMSSKHTQTCRLWALMQVGQPFCLCELGTWPFLPTKVLMHGIHLEEWTESAFLCCLGWYDKEQGCREGTGKVKAAKLMGGSKLYYLTFTSCYIQKPFYVFSHNSDEIIWTVVSKKVYSNVLVCPMNTIIKWTLLVLQTNIDLFTESWGFNTIRSGDGIFGCAELELQW